jgi:hypothetical protein
MDAIWGNAKVTSQQNLRSLAMDAFTEHWEAAGMPDARALDEQDRLLPRTPGVAAEMYTHYISQRWNMLQASEVISIEQPLAIPMPGLEGKYYIGKLDKVIDYNGQVLILEHKTTTAYAINGNFQPYFTESWNSAPQIKGYEVAAGLYYGKIGGVWVDASLVHKKVHDAFKFIPVAHQAPMLAEWLDDTKEWIRRIEKDETNYKIHGELRDGMFPKNEESCFGKYGTCPFLPICSTVTDPSKLKEPPVGFIEERWEPFNKLRINEILNKTTNDR